MPGRIKAASKADVAPGAAVVVQAFGKEVALFNVGGRFHAVDNACPHRGAPLSDGRLDGGVVTCPWHGWQFNVTDGSLLMNPASKLATYKVVQEGDDLYIET